MQKRKWSVVVLVAVMHVVVLRAWYRSWNGNFTLPYIGIVSLHWSHNIIASLYDLLFRIIFFLFLVSILFYRKRKSFIFLSWLSWLVLINRGILATHGSSSPSKEPPVSLFCFCFFRSTHKTRPGRKSLHNYSWTLTPLTSPSLRGTINIANDAPNASIRGLKW